MKGMNGARVEMDGLDNVAAGAFPGYLVRKDLVRRYARQYPVPTYVVEFLLGRYCASVEEEEIEEGLGCCFLNSPVGPPRESTALFRRRIGWDDGAIRDAARAGAVALLLNRSCRSGADVGASAPSVGKRWGSARLSTACPHAR